MLMRVRYGNRLYVWKLNVDMSESFIWKINTFMDGKGNGWIAFWNVTRRSTGQLHLSCLSTVTILVCSAYSRYGKGEPRPGISLQHQLAAVSFSHPVPLSYPPPRPNSLIMRCSGSLGLSRISAADLVCVDVSVCGSQGCVELSLECRSLFSLYTVSFRSHFPVAFPVLLLTTVFLVIPWRMSNKFSDQVVYYVW